MIRHVNTTKYRQKWKRNPENLSAVSETVPNQTMSIKELLKRHVQGEDLPKLTMIHDPEGVMPDPRTLDLVDVQEMKYNSKQTQNDFKQTVKQSQARKKTADSTTSADTDQTVGKDQPATEQTDATTVSGTA